VSHSEKEDLEKRRCHEREFLSMVFFSSWGRIQRKTWYMGPCAGVDYNLILCRLQSRLRTCTMGNPMLESTLTIFQSRLYSPVRDLGFGLCCFLWLWRFKLLWNACSRAWPELCCTPGRFAPPANIKRQVWKLNTKEKSKEEEYRADLLCSSQI
jgi:hypothetical protein